MIKLNGTFSGDGAVQRMSGFEKIWSRDLAVQIKCLIKGDRAVEQRQTGRK